MSISRREKRVLLEKAEEYLPATIHMFAAGRVGQKSMETSNVKAKVGLANWAQATEIAKGNKKGGCTTSSLLKAFYKNELEPQTYTEILEGVRKRIKGAGLDQVPQLSSSRPLDGDERFSVLSKSNYWSGTNKAGKKRALVIGIKYTGEDYCIPGCHNDVWNMIKYLKRCCSYQDDEITILMDDGTQKMPTAESIRQAMYQFARDLQDEGDVGFFHFSGHGAQLGSNKQVIMPIDDCYINKKGRHVFVEDSEIFRLMLLALPKGVKLTAVLDCCHSGQMLNLPFQSYEDKHHEDIHQPDFRHSKYFGLERMRIESMKAIGMPSQDMEEMILPTPKTWRDRTLGEGWDDFYRYNPKKSVQVRRVVRRSASSHVSSEDDQQSVCSFGALDRRKTMKRTTSNASILSGMSGLTGFKKKAAPSNISDGRSQAKSLFKNGDRKIRRQRNDDDDDDGSVHSMGALGNRRKKDVNRPLSKWKNTLKDYGNNDDDDDNRSISSMGALDKKKKMAKLGRSNSGVLRPAKKKSVANDDDKDDRSVSSMGALSKKKEPSRRKSGRSGGGMDGFTGFCSSSSKPSKAGQKIRRTKSVGQLGSGSEHGTKSTRLSTREEQKRDELRKTSNRSNKSSSSSVVSSSSTRSTKKKSLSKWKNQFDTDDDDDDRSVSSTHSMGALDKKRRVKRSGSKKKKPPRTSSDALSTKNSSSKKSSLFNGMGNAYNDDEDYDSDDGNRSVSSAYSMGALDTKGRVKRSGKKRPSRTDSGVVPSSKKNSLFNNAGNDYNGDSDYDNDGNRSVSSMGALEKKKQAARLTTNNSNDLTGISISSKHKPIEKDNIFWQCGDDDQSIKTMGVVPKKHMSRNSSMNGLTRFSNSATPIKHKPVQAIKRAGSAGQLSGSNSTTSREERKKLRNGSSSSNAKWSVPNSKSNILGRSEHGTRSTPRKHKSLALSGLERPQKHLPGSYLPGSLSSADNQPQQKHMPKTLGRSQSMHTPVSRPPPIRKGSSSLANKKKLGGLSASTHSTSSFYSCASDYMSTQVYEVDLNGSDIEESDSGNKSRREEVAVGSSGSSIVSDVTEDDASFSDDDDDGFLMESRKEPKHTSHSITDIRNARRRKDGSNRNLAKGGLDALLAGMDDEDPDFSRQGHPGSGMAGKPRKKTAPLKKLRGRNPSSSRPVSGGASKPRRTSSSLSASAHSSVSFHSCTSEITMDTFADSFCDESDMDLKPPRADISTASLASSKGEVPQSNGSSLMNSTTSLLSDVTDASFAEDDSDGCRRPKERKAKYTTRSIQDIRNARRRQEASNGKLAKGFLDSMLGAEGD